MGEAEVFGQVNLVEYVLFFFTLCVCVCVCVCVRARAPVHTNKLFFKINFDFQTQIIKVFERTPPQKKNNDLPERQKGNHSVPNFP